MLGVDEPSIPAEAAGADWRPFVLLHWEPSGEAVLAWIQA